MSNKEQSEGEKKELYYPIEVNKKQQQLPNEDSLGLYSNFSIADTIKTSPHTIADAFQQAIDEIKMNLTERRDLMVKRVGNRFSRYFKAKEGEITRAKFLT